jgi:PAS domain S-box-containing protein
MERLHSLLKRQIKRYFGQMDAIPEEWKAVVNAVSDAYCQMDMDREMLERSLEMSSNELLEANSEMRAIFQTIPDLLFRLDHEGTILDYKAGSTSDFIIQPQIMCGRRIQDIPFKDISDLFQEAIDRLQTDKSLVRIEYTIMVKGEKNFYEARLLPLLEDQIIAIIRNISGNKKMEEALRESLSKFRQIFETIEDAYFELDSEGIITILSPSVFRVTDWNTEDLIGKPVNTIYANPDDGNHLRSKLLENGYVNDYELLLKKKCGEVLNTALSARLVLDGNGQPVGVRGLLRDITERKRAEEDRERLISELQKALSDVRQLSGLLPICASCKKIRDDNGYWNQIESYIKEHSGAEFSHSLCPDCIKVLYPEFYKKKIIKEKENKCIYE